MVCALSEHYVEPAVWSPYLPPPIAWPWGIKSQSESRIPAVYRASFAPLSVTDVVIGTYKPMCEARGSVCKVRRLVCQVFLGTPFSRTSTFCAPVAIGAILAALDQSSDLAGRAPPFAAARPATNDSTAISA